MFKSGICVLVILENCENLSSLEDISIKILFGFFIALILREHERERLKRYTEGYSNAMPDGLLATGMQMVHSGNLIQKILMSLGAKYKT